MAAIKILRMKRQNSTPQPIKQNVDSVQRRKSHESGFSLNSIISSNNGIMDNSLIFNYNKNKTATLPRPSILSLDNTHHSFKKVTLPDDLPGTMPQSPPSMITFGYASAAHHFRKSSSSDCIASTSDCKDIEADNTSIENEHQIGLFFLRNSQDNTTIPMYCHQPVGEEADVFLQNIGNKYKEKLKKFIEIEKADDSEHYVWINGGINDKNTILSLTQLKNHFTNDKMKRVKWRHLSIDRITVYRYSVPIITTKFRLRIMHFLSKNYRCCILCVWCFVILFISIGIVLSVIFGSSPYANTISRKNATNGYLFT